MLQPSRLSGPPFIWDKYLRVNSKLLCILKQSLTLNLLQPFGYYKLTGIVTEIIIENQVLKSQLNEIQFFFTKSSRPAVFHEKAIWKTSKNYRNKNLKWRHSLVILLQMFPCKFWITWTTTSVLLSSVLR